MDCFPKIIDASYTHKTSADFSKFSDGQFFSLKTDSGQHPSAHPLPQGEKSEQVNRLEFLSFLCFSLVSSNNDDVLVDVDRLSNSFLHILTFTLEDFLY